jgi:hypothetical protein
MRKELTLDNITINDIHNYCQIGYQFFVELTEDWDYFKEGTRFYIVRSEIDPYDLMDRKFYIEERDFADYNSKLANNEDFDRDEYIVVGLYNGESLYGMRVIEIIDE